MAEKKPEAAEGGDAPKKKGKLMLFVIIGVVVLALIGGGAAFLLLKKAPADSEDDEEVTTKSDKSKKKDKKKDPHSAPAFYKVDKPFTVKLQSEGQEAYLQVEVQLKLLNATLTEEIKVYDPEIKHKVTLLLLGKKSPDLNNPQGVQRLSNEIRDTINNIIEPADPRKKGAAPAEPAEAAESDAPVQAVLFTTFIIQ